jgi:hypothetical protein
VEATVRRLVEVERYGTVQVGARYGYPIIDVHLPTVKRADPEEPGQWVIELDRGEALELIAALALAVKDTV